MILKYYGKEKTKQTQILVSQNKKKSNDTSEIAESTNSNS